MEYTVKHFSVAKKRDKGVDNSSGDGPLVSNAIYVTNHANGMVSQLNSTLNKYTGPLTFNPKPQNQITYHLHDSVSHMIFSILDNKLSALSLYFFMHCF